MRTLPVTRRQFLKRALLAVPLIAAPAALAELVAPKRTILLPPKSGWPQGNGYSRVYEDRRNPDPYNFTYFAGCHFDIGEVEKLDMRLQREQPSGWNLQWEEGDTSWWPTPSC